jgi:phage terminase large subunit
MAQLVVIPYRPRDAFKPLHTRSQRWAVVVAHRRAGKTVACVNELIKAALTFQGTDGRFAYVAPFYSQAKAVAWDYAKRFSAVVPGMQINESELKISYPNGASIRLFGADNADSLRGLYFDGLVADEYGDWKPSVWGYVIRPALADRGGWAVIIGTPKGRNEFFDVYQRAGLDDDWLVLTIKASESGLLPAAELDAMRKQLTEDAWRQEMECDFDAALPGAIFGKELWQAEQDGRIKPGLYDPALKTHAVLDLGFTDDTAIWWFQVGKELRLIDCYSTHGMPISHYHEVLKGKPYNYGQWLWLPNDARAKSLQTGRSIEEQLGPRGLGWHTRIVPELGLIDGVQAARLSLADCYIDTNCAQGVDALKQYQREYDEDKKCFRDKPRHDWTSHYADAFRYACLVWREEMKPKEPEPTRWPLDRTFNEILKRQTRRRLEND